MTEIKQKYIALIKRRSEENEETLKLLFNRGLIGNCVSIISNNIYEHLLGLSVTPWSERGLKNKDASKKIDKEGREKAAQGQVKGTAPSHKIEDYLGDFENAAYGIINVAQKDTEMQFTLHNIHLPMHHFHYDRFDTTNDEGDGFYSLNYQINPQGEIDRFVLSLDEGEVMFLKKVAANLSTAETLAQYTGKYKIGTNIINIELSNKNHLFLIGSPDFELIPYKPNIFRIKEFADFTIEFVLENGKVIAMKQKDGSGEYEIKKDGSE